MSDTKTTTPLPTDACPATDLLRSLVAAVNAENETRPDGDMLRYLRAKAETLSIATRAEEFLKQNTKTNGCEGEVR